MKTNIKAHLTMLANAFQSAELLRQVTELNHAIESLKKALAGELIKADVIIKNAQNVMTPHQVQALASLNARDGIVGLHINRHHERRLLIAEAKELYERGSKKARLWRWLFRHTV